MKSEGTSQPGAAAPATRRRVSLWLAGGGVLAAGGALAAWHEATGFAPDRAALWAAVGMGGVYLALLFVRPGRVGRGPLTAMFVLAVLIRLPWFAVPPSEGRDYWRFFWDGAVTAHGVSPYRHSPRAALEGRVREPSVARLAERHRPALERIGHPHLRTIYPPVAQGAFALSYWIAPFNLTAWRVVLLAFDGLAALAVVGLLRRTGLPLSLAFVYLWNPLLGPETYLGGHMDVLAAAAVACLAWALVAKRPVVAAVALAAGVGVKLWPVLLLPFVVRAAWSRRRQLVPSLAVLAVLLGGLAAAFAPAIGERADSGLLAYAETWRSRPGAYRAFAALGEWLRDEALPEASEHAVGRLLMLLVLLPAAGWLGLAGPRDPPALCRRMGLVILLMLLLAPVIWPWYYVALLPLAAGARLRLGLLTWTALLPLVYVQPPLTAAWVLLVVHAPVWLILAGEWAWPRVLAPGREADHA